LESTNGTFVNGRRIERSALAVGDIIRLGDVIGIVTQLRRDESTEPHELAPSLLGSAALERVLSSLRDAAREGQALALIGETGCGKSQVARALHAMSGRSGALTVVDCADGAPRTLRALFEREQPGSPRGGTLLLRKLTLLPLPAQELLLARWTPAHPTRVI